jgi:hypothetical protein
MAMVERPLGELGFWLKGEGTMYGQREILSFFKGRGCFVVFIFKR